MKVLLILPPFPEWLKGQKISQPLGLGYLASNAPRNVELIIKDMMLENKRFEDIIQYLQDFHPDIVRFSVPFTLMYKCVCDMASIVKEFDRKAEVIIGGTHPSAQPLKSMEYDSFDYLVIGEGEISFSQFLTGHKPETIDGFCYKKNGQIICNPKNTFAHNIDQFKFPDRKAMNIEGYWEVEKVRGDAGKTKWAPIITSRGCPWRCVFCAIHSIWGRRWRARSAENVVEEIDELVNGHGVDTLLIEDDNFTIDLDRAKRILKMVIDRGYNLSWRTPNGIRADRLDFELMELMKKAGFKELTIGVESGNQYVNNHIVEKRLNLKKVEEVVKKAAELDIPTDAFFILGFPGETYKEMEETIDFAMKLKSLGLKGAHFYAAIPFPGSRLYEICKERGYLNPEIATGELHYYNPVITTEEFTSAQVKELIPKAYRDFEA